MAKGRIIIDENRCKGCELCTAACPGNLIEMSKKLNTSGFHFAVMAKHDECNGCTLCAIMCPDIASLRYW